MKVCGDEVKVLYVSAAITSLLSVVLLHSHQGCNLSPEVLVSRRTFERSRSCLREIWECLSLILKARSLGLGC